MLRARITYENGTPSRGDVVDAVLVRSSATRSGTGAATVTVAVAALSAGSISGSCAVAVAVLESAVPAPSPATRAVIVTCAAPCSGSAPSAQRTVVPSSAQLPCPADAPANVTPAGSGSSSVTSLAADGPAFTTPIVHVTWPPATAPGVALVTRRSTAGPTVVGAVAVLSAGSGSPSLPSTAAVLSSCWSASALGTPTRTSTL